MDPLPGGRNDVYDFRHSSEFQPATAIMKRRSRRNLATILAVAGLLLFVCNAAAQEGRQERCKSTVIGTANVAAVRDGRTLLLADGRELRLAGIEVIDDSRGVLRALIGAHPLRLERPVSGQNLSQDRCGRLVAFAFPGDSQQSLQQGLLEAGLARVSARIGDKACADALLTLERTAREAHRGLWADPNFAPLQAENLSRLQSERGRFALVEGTVLSVRDSGATLYVNFGRRWTRDFTVTILRRQQRAFAATGVEPKRLEGRRIRVRGWIEQRGGSIVEADAPEQIEFVD
jgi:endonuclease YncB( thermonuclease family)